MIFLSIVILLILFIIRDSKLTFLKMREGCDPIIAKVVEYRNEKSPMRNDYTKIPYPYVSFNATSERVVKLKYANSFQKPFEIGQEVNVFWCAGVLYYWNAYDGGIYKYVPGRIKFKK